jgi:hypothetical protein
MCCATAENNQCCYKNRRIHYRYAIRIHHVMAMVLAIDYQEVEASKQFVQTIYSGKTVSSC